LKDKSTWPNSVGQISDFLYICTPFLKKDGAMYAIVDIAGQQFKVEKDQILHVHRLDAEEGSHVEFGTVLLTSDKGKVSVGTPQVEGARVAAKVISHERGDKVIVFHKKRRKGYQKSNGHRQSLTEIQIEGILAKGAKGNAKAKLLTWEGEEIAALKKKAAPKAKAAAQKAAAPKVEAPKEAPKASAKADDLKKIEGIGPKIASVLAEAGISSFAVLAKTAPEKISELIANVRGNHVTDTWPDQAKLAAEGKWDELQKWQDELNGGKE
jgi:large subunit ribosomal protein L21